MSSVSGLLAQANDLKQKIAELGVMSPAQADNFHQRYRTYCTYTSNAIEGNTLTHSETSIIINDHLSVAGKKMIEVYEAINHAKAYDLMTQRSKDLSIKEISLDHLCTLHTIILSSIHDTQAGKRGNVPVRILGSQTVLPNYLKIPQLMDEYIDRLHNTSDDPLLIAIHAHLRFVAIHPFIDGNGRTARLLLNLIAQISGYPPIIIENSQRAAYISSIEQSTLGQGDNEYIIFMLQAVIASCHMWIDHRTE